MATFGDSWELCCGFLRQNILDFTVTDLSGVTQASSATPWSSFILTISAISMNPTEFTGSLLSYKDEGICSTNFDTWEAIIGRDPLSSCLSSAKGQCDQASALTSCSSQAEGAFAGFYCQYPPDVLPLYSARIQGEVAALLPPTPR